MCVSFSQGTFGREPQAKPEDDRYLRAAIQEYDNIAKLGQIMREGPIKVRHLYARLSRETWQTQPCPIPQASFSLVSFHFSQNALGNKVRGQFLRPPPVCPEKKNKERDLKDLKQFRLGAVDWLQWGCVRCYRLCLILTAVLPGFPAQGGPGRLPEAEKALCSSPCQRVHQPGRSLVSHWGGLEGKSAALSAPAVVLLLSDTAGEWSCIPLISLSDDLSSALTWHLLTTFAVSATLTRLTCYSDFGSHGVCTSLSGFSWQWNLPDWNKLPEGLDNHCKWSTKYDFYTSSHFWNALMWKLPVHSFQTSNLFARI